MDGSSPNSDPFFLENVFFCVVFLLLYMFPPKKGVINPRFSLISFFNLTINLKPNTAVLFGYMSPLITIEP